MAAGLSACAQTPAPSAPAPPDGSTPARSSAPAISSTPARTTPAHGAHLDVAAFAQALPASGTVIVDVRTPQEFAEGHLQGALLADVSAPDFASRLAGLDRSRTYAVYCRSGNRSRTAVDQMSALGFTHVYGLDGGINDWTAAGRPITR
ncbi:MAG: rhodanese-like domain-containing protein [Austwickia sp.]|nr:rhodanese-like domain-containing protein [Austwickia sp.]MBK8437570.1 rhodanese-like domain-containing protein [Austwickia sp.]MBK9102836.1 rhodanese-like domain-containing protein [Austwickia sp.]